MNNIVVQLDPDTGNVLVTIPADLVQQLGWSQASTIIWMLDEQEGSVKGILAK